MLVYRNFNQAALDEQYNVRAGIPDYLDIFERWAVTSREVRDASHVLENVHYGSEDAQALDFFPARTPGGPLLVFIHGGYWQSLDKSDFSYLAAPYIRNDINVAVLNYRLAPKVGMDDIVADNRSALIWLHRNAAKLAFDADQMFLSGHSAGGHLTALLAGTDWSSYGLPAGIIKGGCAISGLYDLEPIRLCYLNKIVGLTPEQVELFSPVKNLPVSNIPVILTVGGEESGEYHRLQQQYSEALENNGTVVKIVSQSDGHHFDAVDRFADENHRLFQAMSGMILGRA